MYNFVDTTERYPGQNLPSEALMFNGNYLENVIPGYRTLYVSGREIINTELTELEVVSGGKMQTICLAAKGQERI